jgi:hypothetical protein
MKGFFKYALILLLVLGALKQAVQAGQQIYLSESPNGRYRVLVEQAIARRVQDHIFFRYPLILQNTHNSDRQFRILDGSSPLIRETPKGTFQLHWESARFDWSKDSLKLFIHLEVIEGSWKTYFVDINSGKTVDVTAEIQKNLVSKVDFHDWDCQQPKVQVVQYIEPTLVFIKLTSICGKHKEKENAKLFYSSDSVLFDTVKQKIVSNCMECKDEKSLKKFNKYYLSTIPTPTPVPEETPTTE